MGLNKYVELPSGVEASYWRVETLRIEAAKANSQCECVCMVAGYKDHDARADGKCALSNMHFSWNGEESPFCDPTSAVSPIAACYTKLKTLPQFEGCADVI